MDLDIRPGTYVVATSGGVDSMALLDMLARNPKLKLVVAHYDHGIRSDSRQDRRLIQDVTRQHKLPFVYDEGRLGPDVSEEAARKARYDFLHRVRQASGARAVITAHHQDDLLETAVHNMLRGTGRRGLVSLRSREHLHRPLLHVPKADLIAYAKDQGLVWREDSTNTDLRLRRNYIRHKLLSTFSPTQKEALLQHIRTMYRLHGDLEQQLINHLHLHPGKSELDRHWFIMLPHSVAKEVLHTWLRRHGVKDLTSKTLERLIVAAKTYTPGRQADVDKTYILDVGSQVLALRQRVR
jgi:tRNA(Ile)-lysidine synthase